MKEKFFNQTKQFAKGYVRTYLNMVAITAAVVGVLILLLIPFACFFGSLPGWVFIVELVGLIAIPIIKKIYSTLKEK